MGYGFSEISSHTRLLEGRVLPRAPNSESHLEQTESATPGLTPRKESPASWEGGWLREPKGESHLEQTKPVALGHPLGGTRLAGRAGGCQSRKAKATWRQTEPATPGPPLEEPASARSWEGRWLREPKAES